MKVRICYTENFTDEFRRAVNNWYKEDGLATREEVIDWRKSHGYHMDDELFAQLQTDEKNQRKDEEQ